MAYRSHVDIRLRFPTSATRGTRAGGRGGQSVQYQPDVYAPAPAHHTPTGTTYHTPTPAHHTPTGTAYHAPTPAYHPEYTHVGSVPDSHYTTSVPSSRSVTRGPRKTFSPEQIKKYRRIFDMFDINKNGVVDAKELTAMSKILGYRFERDDVLSILRHFDMDENGVLTFDEFLQAMPGNYAIIPEDQHRRAEFRRWFQEFDRDGNGLISRDEAFQVLSRQFGCTEQKTGALLTQFDVNADGKLSYEEFVGFYMKLEEKKQLLDAAFRQFDHDNKGFVSNADAQRIMGQYGFNPQEVASLVKMHDTNQDGKLQYDEFVHFWGLL